MNTGGLKDIYEMSQSEVAEKLFLSENTIQRIEQVSKESIKEIVLNGGHKHLSPERRFDAILYFSTDIFGEEA